VNGPARAGDSKATAATGLISAATRARLIAELRTAGIHDERVLQALLKVPRHQFVDEAWRGQAYKNKPLPIGQSQTISQPYIVALMTELLLDPAASGGVPRRRILEVGTGSGYQTAVLSELVKEVFSVERLKDLSMLARQRLGDLGYRNIHFGYADGTAGWAAHAPYDGIIVTAAATEVPPKLLEQLDVAGRLVIPVESGTGASRRGAAAARPEGQVLRVIDRRQGSWQSRDVAAVSFVPLLEGKA